MPRPHGVIEWLSSIWRRRPDGSRRDSAVAAKFEYHFREPPPSIIDDRDARNRISEFIDRYSRQRGREKEQKSRNDDASH